MTRVGVRHSAGTRPRGRGLLLAKYTVTPILACLYAVLIFPLVLTKCGLGDLECVQSIPPISKVFWPLLALLTLVLILPHRNRLMLPRNVVWLLVYLSVAGLSVAWAFRPEISSIRFLQQLMIVTSIMLPLMAADENIDLMRILFLCFGCCAIINGLWVLGPPPVFLKSATPGYTGYFPGKNYLGEFAAVALLLSVRELFMRGARRFIGLGIAVLSLTLLFMSNSKTAIGLVFLAPALAAIAVFGWRWFRISPVVGPIVLVIAYILLATALGFDVYRISYMLYGDSTFTGRRLIWEFAQFEIGRHPFLGWGYQSFWLVGPDAPSVLEAPGWVKTMPNAHNGYLDTMLEMGYLGLTVLLIFVCVTLHASRSLIDRDAVWGWLALSLVFFVIMSNGLESTWMRAFEFLWIVFLFVTAEIGRHAYLPRAGARSHFNAAKSVPGRMPLQRAKSKA